MKEDDTKCRAIEPLLVDYFDGELSECDAHRIARHLGSCDACQSEAIRLERSLCIAQRLWKDAADNTALVVPVAVLPPRRWLTSAGTCAACAGIAVIAIVLARTHLGERFVERGKVPGATGIEAKSLVTAAGSQKEPDIEAEIEREVRAARLAVSAKLMASQEGLEQFSDGAIRYLASNYSDTRSFSELNRSLKNGG